MGNVVQFRLRPSPANARRMGTYAGIYIFAFDLILAAELGCTHGIAFSGDL